MGEQAFRYQSQYCEENIWFLCQEQMFAQYKRKVVFISNPNRTCLLWHQKAATASTEPVVWDYHVILLCQQPHWMIWDLDTALGLPITAGEYLDKTFALTNTVFQQYAPLFRVMDATAFIETFSSDRSHMRDRRGQWLAPPPVWSLITIGDTLTLDKFIDMRTEWVGDLLTLDGIQTRYGQPSA